MKRRYFAITLAAAAAVSLLAGCGSTEETSTESVTEGETVYGEITAIDRDSITINVGTLNTEDISEDGEAAGDNSSDSSESANDDEISEYSSEMTAEASSDDADTASSSDESSSDEEAESVQTEEGFPDTQAEGDFTGGSMVTIDSSMLELTGKELTITCDDDTVFTSQAFSLGGMGSFGDGTDSSSAPSGDIPSGDMTDGEAPSDSEGSAGDDSSSAPEIPDGETSGEVPSGGGEDMDSSSAPEIPDGESEGDAPSGEAPDGNEPSDDGSSEEEPSSDEAQTEDGSSEDTEDPAATQTEISIDDLAEGDIISITYDEGGSIASITLLYDADSLESTGAQDAGTAQSSDIEYSALLEISEDTSLDGESYESTDTDENAILVLNDAIARLTDLTIARYSADSTGGDNSSFYGVGAALLTTEGMTYISDSVIDTDSAGGAGIFSYGNGVTYVSDTTITTAQDTSGGIHVAGGGTLYAWDLTVETEGESSAAIRSDRGSGTMVVNGGSYTSNGTGSPAVYSTAEIAISDAVLTANASEAICIEGLNSIYLFDCDLTGNMADDSQNDTTWTVTLYQSQSGDSEEGNSTFQMTGGSLTSNNGGLFYTTNTESTFLLEDVDITASDDCEFFLMCTGNANERGWGSTGSNGADCSFTAIGQEMEGDVIWDSISTLDLYITEGSSLTGAVINDETYAGDGGSGYCSIYIDEDSTWVVTGDSTVTNLYCEGTIVDASGKTVTIKGSDGTVYVSGKSSYTITVESYSGSADLSGASSAASFDDFEVEKPSELD